MKTLPTILVALAAFLLVGASQHEKVILAMGDSLMAGYNLPPGEGFPGRLEAWLKEKGLNVRVVNAGVSGDTSEGGRERLDWMLAGIKGGKPDFAILEFGANDMLRGVDPAVTRANIDAMLAELKEKGIPVLVMGMRAAPNMGLDYEKAFNSIYPDLAKKYGVALYPFYLAGVAADPALNQADGIHPNEAGIAIMVTRAGPVILKLLER